MRRSTALVILCLAFILGVAFHSFIAPDKRIVGLFWWYLAFLVLGGAGLFLVINDRKRFGIWCLGVGIFSFGLFRYAQTTPIVDAHHLAHYIGEEVVLRGTVDALPRLRDRTASYTIRLDGLGGKLLLTAPRLPAYAYGDVLAVSCTPSRLSEYEQFVRREGVFAACAFPSHIARTGRIEGAVFYRKLLAIRTAFAAHLEKLFPNPYGGLLSGILYGDTSGLSGAMKQTFRTTGLAHITALSGYNITMISIALLGALIFIGFTRVRAFPITVALIFCFVLVTGAEASVVRASVMGLLAMSAKTIGRLSRPQGALALAGAIMLAVNPHLLRFDLGFILSFLATIALVFFADELGKRTLLRRLPKMWKIRETGAASAAAILFTLPVVLYMTGNISPWTLLTNILVVPMVPAAMALGFIAVAADFVWHPLGLGLSFIAREPLAYIIAVAQWFGRFGALKIPFSFPAALGLLAAVVIGMWFWKQHPRDPQKALTPAPAPRFRLVREVGKKLLEGYRKFVPPAWRTPARWAWGITFASALIVAQNAPLHTPGLRVYFFDVGQGDGALIRTADGFDVLIDGGPTPRIAEKLGRIMPATDQEIELMVLTHPHADHVVGLTEVFKRFRVQKILATGVIHTTDEYLEWLTEVKRQKIPIVLPKDVVRGFILAKSDSSSKGGSPLSLRNGSPDAPHLEILYPDEDFSGKRVKAEKIGEGGGLNDTSIVAKLTYGNTSFLLMGDATSKVEEQLIKSSQSSVHSSQCEDNTENCSLITDNARLRADVLKVGHHGSKYSTSAEFLDVMKPTYAVIQSGENRYGHPAYSTLRRLRQAGIAILRNDQEGDIIFESDGLAVKRVE